MAIATLSEVDTRIRDLVTRELEWDAAVDASAIGVAAQDGTVTLTGYVDTYLCKLAAERAAKRVRGVRAVANDIEVRPKSVGPTPISLETSSALSSCAAPCPTTCRRRSIMATSR